MSSGADEELKEASAEMMPEPFVPDGSETRREVIGGALWDAREHFSFNVVELGDYVEGKLRVWESARPAPPPSASEIREAIDEFEQLVADRTFLATKPSTVAKQARANSQADESRSRLESLYREQLQEIERLRQDLYRYEAALGRGLTDRERAETYD